MPPLVKLRVKKQVEALSVTFLSLKIINDNIYIESKKKCLALLKSKTQP